MSGFTPGPWGVNKYGSIGAGKFFAHPTVATVEPFYGEDTVHGDHVANARLIAAAPEMYEALTALVAKLPAIEEAVNPFMSMGHVHGMRYSGPNWKDELEVARAALANAADKDAEEPAQ